MNEPKFKVGEEVILQSVHSPELNGNCTILGVKDNVIGCDVSTGITKRLNLYRLDVKASPADLWDESSLRKKHRPSELSLDEIIKEINSKVKS